MKSYNVIGVMSGTSQDGLDIAFCRFVKNNADWKYSIIRAETVPYSEYWLEVFSKIDSLSGYDFLKLHNKFGSYIGDCINRFMDSIDKKVDLIASHGHTVYHRPEDGLTFQLGNGTEISAKCRVTTVSDFRTLDVALKGQGAPLVPVGDELLFGEYEFCLNLGGFANISYRDGEKRTGFDICPVNIIINYIVNKYTYKSDKDANKYSYKFDKDGQIASKGNIHYQLLEKLNRISYYDKVAPKSLGKEWLEAEFIPVINKFDMTPEDKLRTVYEHIIIQIIRCIEIKTKARILTTGGGAFNKFLIKLLKENCKQQIIIPDKLVVKYKEALIFGLLGVLRLRNEINCFSSVTGAIRDSSTGNICYFKT
jgi:anhydro-N-acetylmuramic acid kinase